MWRHRSVVWILVTATFALIACGNGADRRTGKPAASPSPTPTGSPSPTPARSASVVAYSDEGDLYIYDVAADTVRRLTKDPDVREVTPRFTDPATVTYGSGRKIIEVDIASGVKREIRTVPGPAQALDWNPDRTELAVLYDRRSGGDVGLTLRLEAFGGGESRELRAAWLRTRAARGSAVDALVVALAEPGGTILTRHMRGALAIRHP